MKFIVDRKKWYRGKGSEESALLREDGTRCCIGFVGQQCGVSDSLMLDRPCILDDRRVESLKGFPQWMYTTVDKHRTLADEAYQANDNQLHGDAARERELKKLFADHGDEIEFVD